MQCWSTTCIIRKFMGFFIIMHVILMQADYNDKVWSKSSLKSNAQKLHELLKYFNSLCNFYALLFKLDFDQTLSL